MNYKTRKWGFGEAPATRECTALLERLQHEFQLDVHLGTNAFDHIADDLSPSGLPMDSIVRGFPIEFYMERYVKGESGTDACILASAWPALGADLLTYPLVLDQVAIYGWRGSTGPRLEFYRHLAAKMPSGRCSQEWLDGLLTQCEVVIMSRDDGYDLVTLARSSPADILMVDCLASMGGVEYAAP